MGSAAVTRLKGDEYDLFDCASDCPQQFLSKQPHSESTNGMYSAGAWNMILLNCNIPLDLPGGLCSTSAKSADAWVIGICSSTRMIANSAQHGGMWREREKTRCRRR
jgi:hypothetical protein